MIVLSSVHLMLYYRNGVSALGPQTPVETAWPGQVFRNTAALTVTLLVVVGYVLWEGGANLDAPADPTTTDYPARPEWYFLALFQMLNHFSSSYEIIGTMVIPAVVFTVLALLPLLDKVLPKRAVYGGACAFIVVLLGGAAFLMGEAVYNDLHNEEFQLSRIKADKSRQRVLQLADSGGVPPDGAVYLLRRDPLTNGKIALENKCLGCHVDNGHGQTSTLEAIITPKMLEKAKSSSRITNLSEAQSQAIFAAVADFKPSSEAPKPLKTPYFSGYELDGSNAKGEKIHVRVDDHAKTVRWTIHSIQSASDLAGYGSKAWLRGLLANPSDPKYFGKVPQTGGMARWRKSTKLTDKELDAIADWFEKFVMTAPVDLPASEWESREDVYSHPGYDAFHKEGECASCHAVTDWSSPNDEAPNLYGWGSPWWIKRMIERPGAPHNYGYLDESEQMPPFADKLSENDLDTIVRYLKGDYVPLTK
jgi:cytochrome c553